MVKRNARELRQSNRANRIISENLVYRENEPGNGVESDMGGVG